MLFGTKLYRTMPALTPKQREAKELRENMETTLVIEAKIHGLNDTDAMKFLETKGYPMPYSRYKNIVKRKYHGILMEQVNSLTYNFPAAHMQKIITLKKIEEEMWKACNQLDPLDRIKGLKEIASLQPMLSTYEELTTRLKEMEASKKAKKITGNYSELPSSIIEKPKDGEDDVSR